MFFDKGFTSFHLCQIEGIDFGNFGDKVRMKFNRVVIQVMGVELVMGFFREDVSEVFAPFWYNWFCYLGGLGDLSEDSGLVD